MKKEFSLIKNIFFSNFEKLIASPYKMMLALTYKCNLKCKICRIWQTTPREELGIKEIEKIFKGLKNLCWLDLEGGEITLREDLVEILKVIMKNAKRLSLIHLSTNGQLPQRIYLLAKEIRKYPSIIPIINISVDGPRAINDSLKGVEGSYLNSLEAFRLLKGLGKGHYYLSYTISKCNVEHIGSFISELSNSISDFSPSDIHFNVYHTSSNYYNNENNGRLGMLSFKEIERYLTLCKNGNLIKKYLENRYIHGLDKFLNGNRFPLRCQALRSSCFINPYGEVYPCCMYDKVVGDLKDYDFNLDKLWNENHVKDVVKDVYNKKCPGCWSPCEAFSSILGNLFKFN